MSKMHFDQGGGHTACGAETSWQKRIARKEHLDLPRTRTKADVTCLRCRKHWMFK